MQNLITPQTQEITLGVNPVALASAAESLEKEAKLVEVNLSFKNWDTSKIVEFPRAVFLGIRFMPCAGENGEEKLLETAFFMDSSKNLYYKAAYKFVKAVKLLPVNANFSAKYLGSEKIANGNKAETFCVMQYSEKGADNV